MKKYTLQQRDLEAMLVQASLSQADDKTIKRLQCLLYYAHCGSVTATCKQYGITRMTLYRWLQQLEQEQAAVQAEAKPAEVAPEPAVCRCITCLLWRLLQGSSRYARQVLLVFIGLFSLIGLVLVWRSQVADASSWSPTLLVNTESFTIVDEGDGTTDVSVQFGDVLAETISYNRTNSLFTFSNGIDVQGSISGSTLTVSSLVNCDTIDTDGSGNLICGSDDISSATNLYVDETGDTMEGGLVVDIDTYTGSFLQPDDASLSANLVLWLDASQIVGLNDGDPVTTWSDASGNGNDVLGTLTNRPTYETNEIGLQPVVRFDGVDDYLRDAAASYNARTVFVVQRVSSTLQANTDLAQLWGNYGDGVHVAIDARQPEGNWSFDGSGTAQARCGTNGDTFGSTLANGLACDWNYNTAQIHTIEFSASQALTSTTIGSLFPAFTVGTHQYGGDIAEIIVYDRVLTDAERDDLYSTLASKYEIATNSNQAINSSGTVALSIESESTAGPAVKIDIQGDSDSPHLSFGSGGVFDTNLYRSLANTLRTDDSFLVGSTLSGNTINGFGLTDCNGSEQYLQWDAVTQRYSCITPAGADNMLVLRSTDAANFSTNPKLITWEAQDTVDTNHFAHTANASDITFVSTGWYRVDYTVSWDQAAQNNRVGVRCYLSDAGVLVSGSEAYGYSRDDINISRGSCTHSFVFRNTVVSNILSLRANLSLNDNTYNTTSASLVERESVIITAEYLGP